MRHSRTGHIRLRAQSNSSLWPSRLSSHGRGVSAESRTTTSAGRSCDWASSRSRRHRAQRQLGPTLTRASPKGFWHSGILVILVQGGYVQRIQHNKAPRPHPSLRPAQPGRQLPRSPQETGSQPVFVCIGAANLPPINASHPILTTAANHGDLPRRLRVGPICAGSPPGCWSEQFDRSAECGRPTPLP